MQKVYAKYCERVQFSRVKACTIAQTVTWVPVEARIWEEGSGKIRAGLWVREKSREFDTS